MTRDPVAEPVIVCGLGPIGVRVAELMAQAPSFPAAPILADIDPEGARPRLPGELAGEPIHATLAAALEVAPGATVVLSTCSGFDEIADDLSAAVAAGSCVVSSCEEALWPQARHPELAQRIDAEARSGGAAIVGLGINPGFLMDLLPAVVSAPFGEPDGIVVERRVDVGTRRAPLQAKVGVGLTVEQFAHRKAGSGIGHRGLEESIHLLGAALGVRWDEVVSDVEPVVAERAFPAAANALGVDVPAGGVIGMHNFGRAVLAGETRVELDLVMALDLEAPVDRVTLRGEEAPFPVRFEAPGGIPGDDGTARVLLAALPLIAGTAPGLRTVLDLPGGLRGRWWR